MKNPNIDISSVNVDDITYRGASDSEVVVLIGGPGVLAATWRPLSLTLSKDLRVVSLEHHRPSTRADQINPADANIERSAECINQLIHQYAFGRVHLVAWCLGSRLAIAYADTYSSTVSSLVLLAPALSMRFEDKRPDPLHALLVSLHGHARAHPNRSIGNYLKCLGSTGITSASDLFLMWMDEMTLRNYLDLYVAWQNFDTRPALGRLNLPTLVLSGEHDEIVPPSWLRPWLSQHLPGAEYHELDSADHFAFWDKAEIVGRVIHDHICRLPE